MVRSYRVRNRSANKARIGSHQPCLEHLEDRLPPGSLLFMLPGSGSSQSAGTNIQVSDRTLLATDALESSLDVSLIGDHAGSVTLVGSLPTRATSEDTKETAAELAGNLGSVSRRSSARPASHTNTLSTFTPVTAPMSVGFNATPSSIAGLAANQSLQVGLGVSADKTASSTPAIDPAKMPLHFEANFGQTDSKVDYIGRSPEYTVFVASDEVVFNLPPAAAQDSYSVLRMQLVGGNPNVPATEGKPYDGKVNYFLGSDPSQWFTCVPTMGQVSYANVYEGIDVVYYANGSQLEYDFIVNPGADPGDIAVKFDGAERLEVEADGDLVLDTGLGEVVQQRPIVYQEINGTRQEISSEYVVDGNTVGFNLGAYDHSRPLVIDPVIMGYATFIGGSAADLGTAIAVDNNGSAYITGRTGSTNFPTTAGVVDPTHGGGNDAFVAKFTPTGGGLVYATYLGGSLDDSGLSIAVDRQGNAYVSGSSASLNFPTTAGSLQPTHGGSTDAFVAKLSPDGTGLLYSTYLGGTDVDQANGIAVNKNTGVVFVAGATASANFPTTAGAFQTTHGGVSDAFVASLNAAGSALVYSTFVGGGDTDFGAAIAVDGLNRVSLTGQTKSTNFPTTAGVPQTVFGGGAFDAFVTRLKPDGSGPLYSTYLGGSGDDRGTSIAHSGVGQVYVTGFTASANFPTTAGAFQTTAGGLTDAFVTSLPINGKSLVYSTFIGGTADDRGNGIVIDSAGRAYITGFGSSATYPVTPDALQGAFGGPSSDVIFTQLSANGASLLYSTFHGGGAADLGFGLAIDRLGNIYVTGNTISSNLPTSAGAYQTTKAASNDGFVIKYTLSAAGIVPPRAPVPARVQVAPGG